MIIKSTLDSCSRLIKVKSRLDHFSFLEILAGVDATPVAGGGMGGCEGSRAYAVEGTAEQVEKAFAVYKQIYNEPPLQ